MRLLGVGVLKKKKKRKKEKGDAGEANTGKKGVVGFRAPVDLSNDIRFM